MIKAAEEGQQIDLSEMPPAPWELPAETTPASPSPALQSAANTLPAARRSSTETQRPAASLALMEDEGDGPEMNAGMCLCHCSWS